MGWSHDSLLVRRACGHPERCVADRGSRQRPASRHAVLGQQGDLRNLVGRLQQHGGGLLMIATRPIGAGTLVACTDPTAWDAFLSTASDSSILPSWAWGEPQARYACEPTRHLL